MSVAVVIPFQGGCRYRERNFEYVRDHYRQYGWPIVVAEPVRHDVWCKGEAVGFGVRSTTADVLVIADADSLVPADTIRDAVAHTPEHQWVTPHHDVYRLTDAATVDLIATGHTNRRDLDYPVLPGPRGGGITVLTRDAYDTVRGIDVRFYQWGGEDLAFGWALQTLVGPGIRLDADLIHLWHPSAAVTNTPGARTGPDDVEALKDRYQAARMVPRLMRALVEHRDPEPDTPVPAVTFRTGRASRTITVGPKRARFVNHLLTTTDPDLVEALPMFADVEVVP